MIQFEPLTTARIGIIVKMMKDFYAIDNYPIEKTITTSLFEEFIADQKLGKAFLLLNTEEGKKEEVIGYIILTFIFSFEYKGKIAFLDELYIKEAFRGKGIGSNAILFIKEEVKKLDLQLLYLEVEKHNENGQKLYLANGFEWHNRKFMKYISQ
jgi:ribosomal protein S18 acetylase RimI-like enzyme